MRILLDTSIVVEIDRHNHRVVELLKRLMEHGDDLIISTVTVAEILTGSYLRRDTRSSVLTAKEVLNQFVWEDLKGETAEAAAKLFSFLIVEKKQDAIEYPDVLIAATFFSAHCDALMTLNTKDFLLLPHVKEHTYTPDEFEKKARFK